MFDTLEEIQYQRMTSDAEGLQISPSGQQPASPLPLKLSSKR